MHKPDFILTEQLRSIQDLTFNFFELTEEKEIEKQVAEMEKQQEVVHPDCFQI